MFQSFKFSFFLLLDPRKSSSYLKKNKNNKISNCSSHVLFFIDYKAIFQTILSPILGLNGNLLRIDLYFKGIFYNGIVKLTDKIGRRTFNINN